LRFCREIDFTVFARLSNPDIDSFSYYMGEWWTRASLEGPLGRSLDLLRGGWLMAITLALIWLRAKAPAIKTGLSS
jgi:hypothetical protein